MRTLYTAMVILAAAPVVVVGAEFVVFTVWLAMGWQQ